jgi:hypothetical protein
VKAELPNILVKKMNEVMEDPSSDEESSNDEHENLADIDNSTTIDGSKPTKRPLKELL